MQGTLFSEKVEFVLATGRALHEYGAAAHHLERALNNCSKSLAIDSQFIALPTGILATFIALGKHESHIIRVQPGGVHLAKLCQIDAIADRVIEGQLSLTEGHAEIQRVKDDARYYPPMIIALGYACAACGMAASLQGSWYDFALSFFIGLLIGSLEYFSKPYPRLTANFSALSAFIATVITIICSPIFPGISADIVILSSIIALIPGLALVTSFVELSTKNLVAGTARFAGALGDLLTIAFTILLGKKLMLLFLGSSTTLHAISVPLWAQSFSVLALIAGFIILFKIHPRNIGSAFFVSLAAYLISRQLSTILGVELSFFVASIFVASTSNIIARFAKRPGLVTLLPGIILMVPGSIGYRGLSSMFQHAVLDTMGTFFSVVIVTVSIVAGLSFGNAIVPPRRSL